MNHFERPEGLPPVNGYSHAVSFSGTIYLTDLEDLAVRDQYLDPAALPASSLVQVKGLVHPAFRVEIDALAVA